MRVRVVLGSLLVVLCVLAFPSLARGQNPLILVHGTGGSPESTWGYCAALRGFAAHLRDAGYEPGRTLFAMDYSGDPDPDYAVLFHELADLITRVKSVSGSGQVDILTHGMGGLIARYHLNSHRYAGDVGAVVMLGPPNRGMVAALPGKTARYLLRPAALYGAPGGFPGGFVYAGRRAREEYDGLYQEYMVENEFGKARYSSFETWLAGARSGVYRNNILLAQEPPVEPGYCPGSGFPAGSPPEGTDLTRAHYEIIAMAMAQEAYRKSVTKVPGFWETMLEVPPPLVTDIKSLLAHYGIVAGKWFLGWAAREAEDPAKRGLLSLVEGLLGFPLDGVAVDRLIAIHEVFPRDGGGGRVLGNYFLEHINLEEESARRAPRYVILAGKALNVWARFWPGVGPNDLWVEASSAFLPLARDDVFRIYTGPFLNHGWLTTSPSIWRAVTVELTGFPRPVSERVISRGLLGQGRVKGGGYATVWEPRYHALSLGEHGDLQVEVWGSSQSQRTGRGLELQAWLVPVSGGERGKPVDIELRDEGGLLTGSAVLANLGSTVERVLLGVRAHSPLLGPDTLGDFQEDAALRYGFVATALPPAEPEVEFSLEAPGGEEVAFPGEIPSILVQRITKHTTTRKEEIHRHDRWEWDFGDGSVMTEEDPERIRTVVDKEFSETGSYRVTAQSITAGDRPLRRVRWEVHAQAGEVHTFLAETIVPPVVDLEILGPVEWITGRPAEFRVTYEAQDPPHGRVVETRAYPGERFEVTWVRPGRYQVQAALAVKVKYEFPGQSLTLTNTYLETVEVEVLATSVDQ
jgi:pimeloyl-ACP methyl ester carboxylesterase